MFSPAAGQRTVTAGGDGAFVFENLPDGPYHLVAERDGFARPMGGGQPQVLQLKPSEKKTGVLLKLTLGAVVSGTRAG